MNDLINNLKSNTELMEKMGLVIPGVDGTILVVEDPHRQWYAYLGNDDCPGSALFVVRALKVLAEKGAKPFMLFNGDEEFGKIWALSTCPGITVPDAPTMVQACAYALVACFGGEK